MAYLVLKVDSREVCRQELKSDEPVTIGRALECTLWLANPKLSRQHCRVQPDDGKWVLVDLGSRNGTLMRGMRVDSHVLNDGDTFELDNAEITFRDGPLVPARPAAPEAGGTASLSGLNREIPKDLLPSRSNAPDRSADSSLFATQAIVQTVPMIRPPRHMDSTLNGQRAVPLAFARPPAEPKVEVQPAAPLLARLNESGVLWIVLVVVLAAGLLWLLWGIM
jgi:predicted component of type VI protein secretion system